MIILKIWGGTIFFTCSEIKWKCRWKWIIVNDLINQKYLLGQHPTCIFQKTWGNNQLTLLLNRKDFFWKFDFPLSFFFHMQQPENSSANFYLPLFFILFNDLLPFKINLDDEEKKFVEKKCKKINILDWSRMKWNKIKCCNSIHASRKPNAWTDMCDQWFSKNSVFSALPVHSLPLCVVSVRVPPETRRVTGL